MIRARSGTPPWRAAVLGAFALAAAGPAFAQPTAEQQSAIRSSCRSDFMSNCSGVTPGGKDALQWLQRNVEKLSPGCKSAVSATIPAAPAPAASAPPPPAAPAPAPAPAASVPPPSAPAAAAPATTPPASAPKPAAAAPAAPPSRPAPPPKPAVAATPPAAAAPAGPPAPPPGARLRPPLLREMAVVNRLCGGDMRALCGNVPPGGGRIIECLGANQPALSPGCKRALAPLWF